MRYLDLPIGAVLLDSTENIDLVVRWEGDRCHFFGLNDGRTWKCSFTSRDVIPDDDVLLRGDG